MSKRGIVLALALSLNVGCAVNLEHRPLAPVEQLQGGEIAVERSAGGMSERIGWGTITAFAIPVARVTVNGKADEALMLQIKSGLEHLGYSVRVVADAAEAPDLPLLSCQVKRFKFRNYTWLFPLVFNWGKIDLTMSLASAGQQPIWRRDIAARAGGFYSFEKTVNKALTKVLDQMVRELASMQVQTAERGSH